MQWIGSKVVRSVGQRSHEGRTKLATAVGYHGLGHDSQRRLLGVGNSQGTRGGVYRSSKVARVKTVAVEVCGSGGAVTH
jgi:hypothetical protein